MNGLSLKEPADMTPEELGGEIRMLTRQAKNMALNFGIQIGYRLQLAKEKVDNFVEWVEKETEFSKSSAYRFIQLYTEYGADQTGIFGVENSFPTLGKVSISNALRLLAVPEEEREKFAEEVDAEHISARELEAAIKERDEKLKEMERLQKQNDELIDAAVDKNKKLADELEKARQDLTKAKESEQRAVNKAKELENRPVEVAVQVDETKIKEQAAEIERLKRRLIVSDTGAREAAIYTKAMQENFAAAMQKLTDMHAEHPEQAEKLTEGISAILREMREKAEKMNTGWRTDRA